MDPINPTAGNPEAVNHMDQTPAQIKKTSSISVLAVTIFVLLSLVVVAFLYYQNQKLKGMLAQYQPSPTAAVTPLPTTNPNEPIVSSPSANMKVMSPLKVTGTVPAGWMFEGVFPIKLLDSKNKVLAQGQAKEKVAGSWQSGSPVDFTATLTFKAASGSGTLVLSNDNPSGNPDSDKTFTISVNF